MNRRLFLGAAAGAGVASFTTSVSARTPARRALAGEIETAIARAMERLTFLPGLAVAIYSRDGTFAGGFGVADTDTGERVTPDTAFYIASSTKPLTALALALAHHRGALDLSASLESVAPEAAFPASVRPREVRLHDLLTHTSGIENNPVVFRLAFTGEHDPKTLSRLLASSQPNPEAPLGRFQYTNAGYNIATILTDRFIGVGWRRLLEEEVFHPIGMTRTSAFLSAPTRKRWSLARAHWGAAPEGLHRLAFEKSDETMHSAGGVIMSANDALRWLEFMIEDGKAHGRRVAPAGVAASTREPLAKVTTQEDYEAHHYGLGWFLSSYRGEPMAHHFGDYEGFRAHVSYQSGPRVGVAVFANESSASWWVIHGVANFVYDRLAGRGDAEARFEAAIASAFKERDEWVDRIASDRAEIASLSWALTRSRPAYAGRYGNDLLGHIDITEARGELFIRLGRLHSNAAPADRPDAVLVEFFPYRRGLVSFEGGGDRPDAVIFRGQRFARV